jgi:hypothetical protein
MLNDPERLRQFSNTYLSLKTISPSQFTSLADLDNRLPAPQAELPPRGADAPELLAVVGETDPATPPDTAADPAAAPTDTAAPPAVAEQEPLPVPPIPEVRPAPAVAAATIPADARPSETRVMDRVSVPRPAPEAQPRSVAAAETRSPDQRTSEPRPSDRRVADQRAAEPRAAPHVAETRVDAGVAAALQSRSILPVTSRPLPANPPINVAPTPLPAPSRPAVVATSAPFTGSLLGMAHGSMPPAPRPTPVSEAYNSN